MITFRDMKLSRKETADGRSPQRLLLTLGLVLSAALPQAGAQVTLTHTEDASPIPAGNFRFRMTTGWTRYDELFGVNGVRGLSEQISADSLGPRQLPLLVPVENALKTLSNNPSTRLTFGTLAAESDIRTVVTPIVLEYGITRRLSIGMKVPIIQTRRAIHFSMNADSTRLGNTGFLPPRLRGNAAQANATVYAAFQHAADSLTTLIAKCPGSPSLPGCSTVNGNLGAATATRDQAQAFATAVRTALGTDTTTTIVAPRAGSPLALSIDARQAALNTQIQVYLGPTAGTSSSVFTATTDFSYIDLQGRSGVGGLLASPLGGKLDSLQTTNRLRLDGVTFAAQYMVFDRFHYDTLPFAGVQSRLAAGAELRFDSAPRDSAQVLVQVSPVQGSGFAVHGAMDIVRGKLGATIVGRYDKAFARTAVSSIVGDPEAFYPVPVFATVQETRGDILTLDLTPRLLLGQWFAIDGLYGLERTGATTYDAPPSTVGVFTPNTSARTAQRVGFGIRSSTIDSYRRGATRTPVEVSFTHMETITGDVGTAKIFRDQVQVRIYWAAFGNH